MFHVAAPKYSRLGTPHVVYVSPSHVNGNSQGPEGMHAVYPSRQGGCRDRRDRDRDSQSACPAGLGHAGDTVPRDRDTPATLSRGTGTRRRHCPAGRGTKWDACGTHCGFSNIGDRLGPFGRCPHRRTLIQHQYHAKCRFRGLLHSEMSKHGGCLANLKIFSHFRGRQTFFEQ